MALTLRPSPSALALPLSLAVQALEALDFVMADKSFVRCADYQVRGEEGGAVLFFIQSCTQCPG